MLQVMTTLNRYARDVGCGFTVHACTDITGFGLWGHALEMAKGSQVTIRLKAERIPVLCWAEEYASMGLVPVGAYRNREFVGARIRMHRWRNGCRICCLIRRPPAACFLLCRRGKRRNFAAGCPREHIGGGDRKSGERQDVCLLVE